MTPRVTPVAGHARRHGTVDEDTNNTIEEKDARRARKPGAGCMEVSYDVNIDVALFTKKEKN